jgi:type VI secretion system secreted protein VgrG
MPAATYTQKGRPLLLTTPLGPDALLAVGLTGSEGVSQPFRLTIDAKAARGTTIPFDRLIGQDAAVQLELPNKSARFFHGVVVRVLQGESDSDFTDYQIDIVPRFWLLSKKAQSRIFQHLSVPDILKQVLAGIPTEFKLSGTFHKRDFCVQYRETDFNFASRLMEEEGIFYFFKHTAGGHTMVLGNTPQVHPDVPGPTTITYQNVSHEGPQNEDHIYDLAKVQEQISGKFLLWDHNFELPHKHLEAEKPVMDSVSVGKVSHKLKVGDNGKLEVYDWPGEYAQRFDGIDTGGGEQPGELQKIFDDNLRTVELRMQAEAATAISIRGSGTARQLASGHKFKLTTKPADLVATPIQAEGEYVITNLTHAVRVAANYRTGDGDGFQYSNSFTAIPAALPFRPQRLCPKPVISGTQTAVVVGPPGEEIFTDKYGRIKVQFHWDRQGKKDADSSCWIRVVHVSAGRNWGAFHLPRIGQEVLIDFEEGDPDRPICIGCVYNPDQMPMYKLPDEKTKSYIRTNTSMGGIGYNEIRFEDKKDKEQIYVHAQRNMDVRVRNDSLERVGNDRHLRVGFYLPNDHKGDTSGEQKKGSQFEEVAVNQHLKVHNNKDEHIGGDLKLLVGGIGSGDNPGTGKMDIHIINSKRERIDDTSDLHVKKLVRETFEDDYHLQIGGGRREKVGDGVDLHIGTSYQEKTGVKHAVDAGNEIHLKAGVNVVIEALNITLKGGGGFITISPAGVAIQGTMVLINSGGTAISGSGSSPLDPSDASSAIDAKPIQPKDADCSKTGHKSN